MSGANADRHHCGLRSTATSCTLCIYSSVWEWGHWPSTVAISDSESNANAGEDMSGPNAKCHHCGLRCMLHLVCGGVPWVGPAKLHCKAFS